MLPVLHGSLEGFGQMAPYKASDGEHHASDPRYLADLCVPAHSVHGRQQLRSTASGTLLVPPARTATGQRRFAISEPRTWNSLPADLRAPDTTLCSLKRHLKAHLFQQ